MENPVPTREAEILLHHGAIGDLVDPHLLAEIRKEHWHDRVAFKRQLFCAIAMALALSTLVTKRSDTCT